MSVLSLLTQRELEILNLIVCGLTDREIGDALNISKNTVSTHRKKILTKLKLNNSASLVRVAVQNGMPHKK
ncbi:MAG: response regulator transcription factor [Bacteroidetes bacterium]|nr:response regulator transcription factor [Bacteroidota bacterium]